jgi:hypothetical protein
LLVKLQAFVDDSVLDVGRLILQPADHGPEETFISDLLIGKPDAPALLIDPESKPPTVDPGLYRKRDR